MPKRGVVGWGDAPAAAAALWSRTGAVPAPTAVLWDPWGAGGLTPKERVLGRGGDPEDVSWWHPSCQHGPHVG